MLMCVSMVFASGPKYNYPNDPHLNDEMDNLYKNIKDASTNLIVQKTVTISSNATWTGERYIACTTLITLNAGTTLIINGPLVASNCRIFSGLGKVQFGSAFHGKVYPEWWGGTLASGTDDAVAISSASAALVNGGVIQLGCRQYTLTSTITLNNNNITLQGCNVGASPYDNGGGLTVGSQLIGTPSVNGITLTGTYMTVKDLDISLLTGTTAPTTAITITGCFLPKITNVRTTNYSTGIHVLGSTDIYLSGNYLSSIGVMATPVVGIDIDGGSHIQNASVYVDNNISAAGSFAGSFYAYWLHGNRINDVHFTNDEADGGTYGFYIDGTSGIDNGYSGDIFIENCAADGNLTYGYYVNAVNHTPVVNLNNSWASGGADGIFINNSAGVNITGTQIYGGTNGIYILNSSNTVVSHNTVLYSGGSNNSIAVDNSPYVTVDHNMIIETAGSNTAINILTGSSQCVVVGNIATGPSSSFANGIVINPGSDVCNVTGNSMPTGVITTPFTFNGANTVGYNAGNVYPAATAMSSIGLPSGTISATDNIMKFQGSAFHTNGDYNSSTGSYTVVTAGYYMVNAQYRLDGTATTSLYCETFIYQNTTKKVQGITFYSGIAGGTAIGCSVTGVLSCVAGDTIALHMDSNIGTGVYTNNTFSHLDIARISGGL